MIYPVKQESIQDFVSLWEEKVLNLAIRQDGFVRMQLLIRDGEAMALGTWNEKAHAEAFMAQGPFKELMASVSDMLSGDPAPTIWELAAFAAR